MEDIAASKMSEFMDRAADQLESVSLKGPLTQCLDILGGGFEVNFHRAEDSRGGAWPARKDNKPHPLLQETGALLGATQKGGAGNISQVEDRQLATGVDKSVDLGGIPGAAVSNFGYPPRNIPQREYLYATEDVLLQCQDVIANAVLTSCFGD